MIPAPRPHGDADTAPALVLYSGRLAVVLHPDPTHENAVAARLRLERRGFVVIAPPADLRPFLRGVPQILRVQARELVASGAGRVAP